MVQKKKITSSMLCEAPEYGSSFSRGLEIPLGEYNLIMLSGTASVDEKGETFYPGDLTKQIHRTFGNLTDLLEKGGVTWHDVVFTRIYLKDIARDYNIFNKHRTAFYDAMTLNPYPASVCVQARLCRVDLLIEIELSAIKRL